MRSASFPEANQHHTAPTNWDAERDGECKTLSVHNDGTQFISRWELSWMDRFRILFGASVWLYIIGARSHPVVGFNVARTVFKKGD